MSHVLGLAFTFFWFDEQLDVLGMHAGEESMNSFQQLKLYRETICALTQAVSEVADCKYSKLREHDDMQRRNQTL